MGNEFQTPVGNGNGKSRDYENRTTVTILKPLDQAIITALTILVCSLLGWIAYTSHQNSVAIVEISAKFDSIKQERDLGLIYIERRIETIEKATADLAERLRKDDK
jgi:hypothetical protein